MELSIVLPCYNESANLPGLIRRYRDVWEDLPAELILVDNGSTDDTAAVLAAELARPEHAFARTVKVDPNRGYGHGIHTGLLAATGRFVAWSHADMQCDAADVFRGYHRLRAEPDPERAIVKGSRQRRDLAAEVLTNGMSLYSSVVLRTPMIDVNAQPKVFSRRLLERLTDPPLGFEYDLYVLLTARRAGWRQVTIPVHFGERAHGESKWAAHIFSRYKTIARVMAYIWAQR